MEPTKSPSKVPTTSPDHTPCMEMSLTVEVRTDNNPEETSWTIVNTNSGTVEEASPVYTNPDTFYSNEHCVPPAQYTFTIYDSGNDGVCCAEGAGFYRVLQNAVVVASGDAFGSSESHTIEVVTPTSSPTRAKTRKGKSEKGNKSRKATKGSSKSGKTTKGSKSKEEMVMCEGELCDRKRVRVHANDTDVTSLVPISASDQERN